MNWLLRAMFLLLPAVVLAQPSPPPTSMRQGNPPGGAGARCSGSQRIGYLDSSGWMYTCVNSVSTDSMNWTPNANLSGVTGYGTGTADGLKVYPWISSDAVNFAVCNGTGTSITPGAATLNWTVIR